jgi:multidrug efflux system membrane fusion protein
VRLVLAEKKDAVLIPAAAQQVGQQGQYVYVVVDGKDQEGKPATLAELRPITPGQRHGDMVVVDKGLKAGDQVVLIGQMLIMPGGPVKVVPSAPAAGAGGSATAATTQVATTQGATTQPAARAE